MKKKFSLITLVTALLFNNSSLTAQTFYMLKDSAYVRTLDDLPAEEPFDTAHRYHRIKEKHIYIISDHDLYGLFGYTTSMRYYQFDFGKYHILGEQRCEYCDITRSHRNAHDYKWVWVVRENIKAFEELPVLKTRGGRGFPEIKKKIKKPLYNDTVLFEGRRKDTATWYTSGGGDCFARFKYKLYKDKFRPLLLLKAWNYWGGCRAGGHWDFEISFMMPPGINYFSKRTILAERKGDKF